jgi:hypothetical protein
MIDIQVQYLFMITLRAFISQFRSKRGGSCGLPADWTQEADPGNEILT